ncbi:MAG: gliding motility-associated C-terminal domain-containing protein [Chitinophagaceae bacterium]|nr:gliding motility-associated C-terminal domain-containing protein [Chitinophagaceae bacterium]
MSSPDRGTLFEVTYLPLILAIPYEISFKKGTLPASYSRDKPIGLSMIPSLEHLPARGLLHQSNITHPDLPANPKWICIHMLYFMKKSICSLLFIWLFAQPAFSQQQWTWIGGSKQANAGGSYGIAAIPSPSNIPGSRYGACTWTDSQGNFWLFGGSGNAESSSGLLNDLWRYNPSTNQWTWMNGDKASDNPGRYGIIGIPLFQQPGARQNAASWVDKDGNFWMFGGSGYAAGNNTGLLNDLWKYTPSTNTWAWIGGSNRLNRGGDYGRQEQPDNDNIPGGRYLSTTWVDNDGNLWLFGGYGFSEREETGGLNDVWRYSISSQQWTWMKGEKREDRNGRYGQRGQFQNNNTPGGRQGATGWKDNQGRFWLYGGQRGNDLHNDLWLYDPAQNNWAWMSGSDDKNESPEFDTVGVPTSTGHPGGRMSASGWLDPNGDLWLFGGRGYGRIGSPLNNAWKYSIADGTWTFIKGDVENASAVYGTRGSSAPGNKPGGSSGSSAWTHSDGTLWFFGGQIDGGNHNQTWRITPCGSGTISPESAKICEGGSQELTATGGSSFTWLKDNQVIAGATGAKYTATQTGTYSVIVKNGVCEVPGFNTVAITKATAPSGSITPESATICQGASQVLTVTGGTSYLWKRNGLPLPETGPKITVKEGGTYSVEITNGSCKGPASNTAVVTVEPTPAGTITPASAAICNGIGQTLTATGGSSYEWQLNGETIAGQTASTFYAIQPGTYSVIVKGGVCSGPAANTAEVVELNTNGVRYSDLTTNPNVPVLLSARITGESYEWLPYSGLDDPSSATPTARIDKETKYTVTITNEQGCSVVDTQLVKVVPGNGGNNSTLKVGVPTAFTPNGNNVNDRLRPLGNIIRLDYFKVYNRWGTMVYQTSVLGEGWDGKYKGELQPPGTYTWILVGRTSDGAPLKLSGKTVLIR